MAAQVGVLSLVLLPVFCGSVKALGEGPEGPKTEHFGNLLPSFTCSISKNNNNNNKNNNNYNNNNYKKK